MKIKVKLVTLTNCSSGTGDVIRGEGLNSLARAFLAIGAECVVASLWPINKNFADAFMIYFYELVQSKTITDAFSETQKLICNKFTTPSDWASMVIMGNGQQFIYRR